MIATIIISALLVLIVGLILFRQIQRKKRGESSCGCGCSNCAAAELCHRQK